MTTIRAKKPSREDLEAQVSRLQKELGLHYFYMRDVEDRQKPDAIERFKIEGVITTLRLYRATGPCGGYVVITHRPSTAWGRLRAPDRNCSLWFLEDFAATRDGYIANRWPQGASAIDRLVARARELQTAPPPPPSPPVG